MANLATNIISVWNFDSVEEAQKFVQELEEEIFYYTNDPNDQFLGKQPPISLQLESVSKWHCPKEFLEKLGEKYDVRIIGVSYEFGNDYVDTCNF